MHAAETVGFLQVVNHGMDCDLIDRMFAMSKTFFDLPDEVKEKYPFKSWNAGWEKMKQIRCVPSTALNPLLVDQPASAAPRLQEQRPKHPPALPTTHQLAGSASHHRPSTGTTDLKESYQIGYGDHLAPFWPSEEDCPGFKALAQEFMRQVHEVRLLAGLLACPPFLPVAGLAGTQGARE